MTSTCYKSHVGTDAVRSVMVPCSTMPWCSTMPCSTMPCSTMPCSTMPWCSTMSCSCMVLYSDAASYVVVRVVPCYVVSLVPYCLMQHHVNLVLSHAVSMVRYGMVRYGMVRDGTGRDGMGWY